MDWKATAMLKDISYAEADELGEVWVTVRPSSGQLYDWDDLRPHVSPEYRGLPFIDFSMEHDEDGLQEVWVLSRTERGRRRPVRCRACCRKAMRSASAMEPPFGLIADDRAGLFGWAWCPGCDERTFIPSIALGVGIELTHAIDRIGSLPVLVEVF